MKSIHKISIALLVFLTGVLCVDAARGWETLKTEPTNMQTVARLQEIEIKSASLQIVVTTNHPVQIKVFTILGQQISNETLPAGTSRLTVSAHGVYIVKVGDYTCKLAL